VISTLRPGDRLEGFDFAAHNAEVAAMWADHWAGRPARTPIILGLNARYFLPIPGANPQGVGFREYTERPDVMYACQLAFQRWSRHNVLQDAELGPPDVWRIHVDFQNYYEAAWFGCPLVFDEGQVPDTRPVFAECPERVMEQGLPDPFGGIMAKGLEYLEIFREYAAREAFLDRPVEVQPPWFGMGSDGPMTVACNLFGPQFVCTAMAAEPQRLHVLLDFIAEATIARMRAWREKSGVPVPQDGFGMADDSIALISTAMLREHILPYLKRIYNVFATEAPRSIHLCGDATRHFVTLRDELNIGTFDTGFPVDFRRIRRELGPKVRIMGGPHVELLRTATPEQVVCEARRILEEVDCENAPFVLREGNNLAPHTPIENTEALYRAGREYGAQSAVRQPLRE
jgi:uroporphyrinogen-III decarboxylase